MSPVRSQRTFFLYVSMVVLALLAGCMDHGMQRHLHQLEISVRDALRLTMLRLLEGLDYAAAREHAQQDETAAAHYKHAAELESTAADRDAAWASRLRHRGDYLEKLSQMETVDAAKHTAWAQMDDQERLALLQNITALEKDENETNAVLQERQINNGVCGWKVLSPLCATVGGTTALQQRASADAVEIHQEWAAAQQLGHHEAMQTMVADMLKQKSAKYNTSATDLLHVANLWDTQAQRDYERAAADNATAQALWHKAQQEQAEIQKDLTIEYKVDILVQQLMHRAERERTAAYWCAVSAIMAASVALVYFAGKVIPKAHQAVQLWEETKDSSHLAYMAIHVLIFCVVTGMAGHYLVHLEQYTNVQRAVILSWFAIVASCAQTIVLHALPMALQQAFVLETPTLDVLAFVGQVSARYAVFFFMFLLEIVLVWLTLGHGFFNQAVVDICASWIFRILALVAIVAYAWCIECPRSSHMMECDDHSTLPSRASSSWTENQTIVLSDGASEVTPLRKADAMSWGTTIDLAMGNNNNAASSTASVSIYGALVQDLRRLILPWEILLVACMLAVLRNALHVVWISHATVLQGCVLACAMGLLVLIFYFSHEACCEQTWSSMDGKNRNGASLGAPRVPPKFEMVSV
eukprot:scaffold17205_cov186-Amphora_coffeaeformis.AAC.11